jgi:PKD repeat protein
MTARRLIAALATSIGLFAVAAVPASAMWKRLKSGKVLSYLPVRGQRPQMTASQTATAELDYGGGPVMSSNTNYTFYWRPDTGPAYPPDYQPGLDQYFTDIAHDSGQATNVESVATQLNDTLGNFASYRSYFGGALDDADPYPSNGCQSAPICLTDAQLQAEVARFITANGLPADLAHEYFVLTPPGVAVCFDSTSTDCSANAWPNVGFCAYHAYSSTNPGFVYAVDPYDTGNPACDRGEHPNGTTSDGAIDGGVSHEHIESITDPVPELAWNDWATGQNTGYEIGDKCEWGPQYGSPLGTAPNGSPYNQLINGHPYYYQEEWSNQTHQCLQRLAFDPATAPIAYVSATPGKGTTMRLNATGSSAPGGVARYAWQFNDNANPGVSQQSTTSRTVTHKFPGPGVFPVALTVFAHDGTSIGSTRFIAVGAAGPTPAIGVTTLAPHLGTPVAFSGASSQDPAGSIIQYVWTFGDDSGLVAGATPTHTYAAAGTYRVTLTVVDTSGQQASVTRLLTIK